MIDLLEWWFSRSKNNANEIDVFIPVADVHWKTQTGYDHKTQACTFIAKTISFYREEINKESKGIMTFII